MTKSIRDYNTMRSIVTAYNDEELEYFREIITKRKEETLEEIEHLKNMLDSDNDFDKDASAYSFHMADAGSDAMEKEKICFMLNRQTKYLGYLDRALDRIENKTYGICKITGKPIPKERLEAIPHTEISVEAKLQLKR
jgi:RNA polymerase-binding protein DksA